MNTELIHTYGGMAVEPHALAPHRARDWLDRLMGATWAETVILGGLLVAIFCAFLVRLASVVISDIDEGTYLYAGKLVADGLVPYRDFLLVHPPVAIYLAAGWFRLAGVDVTSARMANAAFVLASTVPLYVTVRSLASSRIAALLGVATYTTGILLLADMGRTFKLEPVMNAFLIAAFAIYVLRPNDVKFRVLLGMLFAAAFLTKLVAALPIALIVVGDLLWSRPGRRFVGSWLVTGLGAALVLSPMGLYLLAQPGFISDVLLSQLQRDGMPLELRWLFLTQNFLRYPPILIALLAALWCIVGKADSRLRVASLIVLAGLASLVLLFKSFFAYYVVMVMPWVAVLFAFAACALLRRLVSYWRVLAVSGVVALGVLVPAAYGEVYYRSAVIHVASPANIIPLLRAGDGYMYSMYPLFALWSGRPEYPWYYSADSIMPRLTRQFTSADLIRAFSGSQAVALWHDELQEFPDAQTYLDDHFQVAFQDAYYVLWVRHEAD